MLTTIFSLKFIFRRAIFSIFSSLRRLGDNKKHFMRIFFSLFAAIVLTAPATAQIGMGQWRMHVPASQAIDVAVGNGYVMAALTGGVLEYDIDAAENRVLNNLNALSDIQVTCIEYEPQSASFFVGYENGNLDQITPNGVINIPAIKLSGVTGNKRINKIVAANGLAYIATGFALVVINPSKNEVKDTYYPTNGTEGINDITFFNDSIYALSDKNLYRGLLSNPFLADPLQWTVDSRVPVPTNARYGEMGLQQNEIHISYHSDAFGSDSIFRLTPAGLDMVIGDVFDMEIEGFQVEDDLFYVYYSDQMVAFNEDLSVNYGVQYYNSTNATPARVQRVGGVVWVADRKLGLVRYQATNNYTYIQQEGPPKNQFFSINGEKGKMVVTAGTVRRVEQAYNQPNVYTFQDEAWTLYDNVVQPAWQGIEIWDIGSAAINPTDENNMAFAGYSKQPLSIVQDGVVTNVFSNTNSPLEVSSLGNGNTCITAVEYDEDGNLWMLNGYSLQPLKVRMADGTWQGFETGTDSKNVFTGKLAIDYNGNKWFGIYGTGLVGYDDNGTPDITGDDSYRTLTTGEGAGNLPSENVTALAVDFDNEIWIGTEAGFGVLYNSDGIFSNSNFDASRILITYEGNVEYLLGSTSITDIEIDGGNRKWIATANNGIFMLSADGQEVLAEYTKENSPLISNNIMDMEFNQVTGELFIITDLGLVSLRVDASYEDETYESTTVFPNPVKPDFFGPITIQGIRYDSDVKITDVAGNLVYKTTSNGGTATWNGKTINGEDVASGVYLIWTATNTGKGKKVGKVTVIR